MKTKRKTLFPAGRLWIVLAAAAAVLWGAIAPANLDAREMRESEVRAAAETWVRTTTRDARPDAVIERMEPYVAGGETVAYIGHLAGEGFCLCALDELLLPVYFYAPRGTFDAANPALQCLLTDMADRALMVRGWIRDDAPTLLGMQDVVSERSAAWASGPRSQDATTCSPYIPRARSIKAILTAISLSALSSA